MNWLIVNLMVKEFGFCSYSFKHYDVLPIQSHIFAAIVKRFSLHYRQFVLDTPIEPSILSTIQQMTPARSRMPLLCLGESFCDSIHKLQPRIQIL